ncbi:IFN protein, partial [Corythaeola cristata]|nr:IFN protein [Corythaeola cristata]
MAAPAAPRPRLCHAALLLLLLLTPLPDALACHHLRPHQATFASDSIRLLRAMDPSPPPPCHHHHNAPFFPDTLLHIHHPQQANAAALHVLQRLFGILSSPTTPHHWDAQAHQQLLNNIQHHLQQLQQCLTPNGTLSQGQGPRNLLLDINKYFRHVQHFLRTHNHSACAWDHVRLEARASFQHLHNLTRTMG